MREWKQLSETDILKVAAIIEGWPLPEITWEALGKEVERKLGRVYTRQTLFSKLLIRECFQARKEKKPQLVRKEEADQTVQRLKLRIVELEDLVRKYDLRFLRHVYNARLWDKRPEELDLSMPEEDPDHV